MKMLTLFANIVDMNSKHRKTIKAIFTDPVNGNMEWREIESLLVGLGCRVLEGNGSTVTFEKDGLRASFHRPHPDKAALRYRVKDTRIFLTELGVKP